MEVYNLGQNSKSSTGGQVIVRIQLIEPTHGIGTDMSSFTTDPLVFRHKMQNDFYFPYKINMGKIISIKSLDDAETFTECEVTTTIGVFRLETGKYFKISNHDYSKNHGLYYMTVYKYKASILNLTACLYVPAHFTGAKVTFRITGKMHKRFYFKHGVLVQEFEYYDNLFGSLKQLTRYTDKGIKETEYLYDNVENLTMQRVYNTDGSLFQQHKYEVPFARHIQV